MAENIPESKLAWPYFQKYFDSDKLGLYFRIWRNNKRFYFENVTQNYIVWIGGCFGFYG